MIQTDTLTSRITLAAAMLFAVAGSVSAQNISKFVISDEAAKKTLIKNEISIRILRQPISTPLHAKYRLHPRVIRSYICQANRPVIAKSVVGFSLEFIVAKAKRLSRPE